MNNTVTFKVAGNDVLTFMDTLKKKADSTTADMISNAKKQGGVAKDQLKDIEAQIKALEKRNKLEQDSQRAQSFQKRDAIAGQANNYMQSYIANANQQFKEGKITEFQKNRFIRNAPAERDQKIKEADVKMSDELKSLRESERLQGLQTRLLRDNVDSIHQTSQTQVNQMRRNNSDLIETIDQDEKDPKWILANQVAKEKFKGGDNDEKITAKTVIGGLLSLNNLQGLMGGMNQLGSSENGFDLIHPGSKAIGNIAGNIIGGLIGTMIGPEGTMIGAGIGGSIGTMVGDTTGQFEQRRLIAGEDFMGNKDKYEATTQKELNDIPDMSKLGVGVADYIATLRQIAVNTGSTAMAAQHTKDLIEMEKGVGVGKDVSAQMITYFRGTNKEIANLVEGVMQKGKSTLFAGGDYTFMNEFLQKFNALHNELRNSSEKVATGTTYDILSTFNKIGGQFASRDTRSGALVSGVNSALINPGSDSLQAMSFLALRKDHPNMTYSQLMEEKQKGLASPTYLKSMLKMIDEYGGDRSAKIANTTWLTGGNFAAARKLWDGRKNVGTMSTEEIEEHYKGDFHEKAIEKTTVIEENMALIKNGLLSTWGDGVDAMVESFSNAMKEATNGVMIDVDKGSSRVKMGPLKKNNIRSNYDDPKVQEDIKNAANALGVN